MSAGVDSTDQLTLMKVIGIFTLKVARSSQGSKGWVDRKAAPLSQSGNPSHTEETLRLEGGGQAEFQKASLENS